MRKVPEGTQPGLSMVQWECEPGSPAYSSTPFTHSNVDFLTKKYWCIERLDLA